MEKHTLLSIIIPLYNCEKYIAQCLDSILAQGIDMTDFEVIIVDDGSKDNSHAIVSEYTKNHDNIHVVKQENQGVACARNNAIDIAQGDYITFVDADDMLVEGSLRTLLKIAIEYNADIVKGVHVKVSQEDDYKNYFLDKEEKMSVELMTGEDAIVNVIKYDEGYCWRYLLSRKFIKDNKLLFPHKLSFMEDWVFITQALLKCRKFLNTNIQLYLYRYNIGSCVANMSTEKLLQGCHSVDMVLNIIHYTNGTLKKTLMENVCANVKIILWYTIHYRDLFRDRNTIAKIIVQQMKFVEQQYIPFTLKLFKSFPEMYIVIRHLIAKRKY